MKFNKNSLLTSVIIMVVALIAGMLGFGRTNEEVPEDPSGSSSTQTSVSDATEDSGEQYLDPDGTYDTKEDVALYIHQYGKLPGNFMTKEEAEGYGWSGGALSNVVPGKCIGGDTFGNREGLLPKKSGRTYTECDIGTIDGGDRGNKRIVFSNDGLIYYTEDHYESFTLLYGEP